MNSDQLGLPNLGGVFIVLLVSMIASIVIAFGEFMWENRLLAFTPGKSLGGEMWRELKFSMDFRQGDSKPAPGAGGGGGSSGAAESNALLTEEGAVITEGWRESWSNASRNINSTSSSSSFNNISSIQQHVQQLFEQLQVYNTSSNKTTPLETRKRKKESTHGQGGRRKKRSPCV